jgi:tRNA A22 N-methylase
MLFSTYTLPIFTEFYYDIIVIHEREEEYMKMLVSNLLGPKLFKMTNLQYSKKSEE